MRISVISLCLLFCVALNACKKKDDTKPLVSADPHCVMTSIIEDYNTCRDSTRLTLIDGKLTDAVFYSNCTGQQISSAQQFVYETGRMYHIDSTTMQDRDTFFVDNDLRILEYRPSKGSPEPMTKYFYSPTGELQTSVDYYNGNVADSTHYVYNNGDLIGWHNSRYDTRYTYYDSLAVPANGLLVQQGISYGGASFLKSRHLVKEVIQNNTLACTFIYDFELNGNVSRKRMTIPITGTVYTTRYKYACAVE
jgi:hypothetical protein